MQGQYVISVYISDLNPNTTTLLEFFEDKSPAGWNRFRQHNPVVLFTLYRSMFASI